MIFMALLPKPDDKPVSHAGGYPAVKDLWRAVTLAIKPRCGELVGDGRYRIGGVFTDTGFTLERDQTKSVVKITRSKVEKVYARLAAGEEIPHRKIDYTVAIEFGVLLALGNLVEDDGANYRLGKGS